MRWPPPTALVWFAVLGGGLAWGAQFVANLFLTFAQCNQLPPHRGLPLDTVEIVLSVVAVAIGVAAEGVSVLLLRHTSRDDITEAEIRGEGTLPPIGRINFLALVGLFVNPLAVTIVVMTAIGVPALVGCQQS